MTAMTTPRGQARQGERPALHLVPTTECERRLWGAATGLACIRLANHTGAHVYLDPHGSDVNDRHLDGGHG